MHVYVCYRCVTFLPLDGIPKLICEEPYLIGLNKNSVLLAQSCPAKLLKWLVIFYSKGSSQPLVGINAVRTQ